MSNCCAEHSETALSQTLRAVEAGRLPDLANLPKPGWRDALATLAGPAVRLHRYRNLRTSLVYDAMRRKKTEGSS